MRTLEYDQVHVLLTVRHEKQDELVQCRATPVCRLHSQFSPEFKKAHRIYKQISCKDDSPLNAMHTVVASDTQNLTL